MHLSQTCFIENAVCNEDYRGWFSLSPLCILASGALVYRYLDMMQMLLEYGYDADVTQIRVRCFVDSEGYKCNKIIDQGLTMIHYRTIEINILM
jgi:hypothetical protein